MTKLVLLFRLFYTWLFLMTTAVAAPPKEGTGNQYLVTDLPGLHENIDDDFKPLMFAGQLELFPENNTYYFFWKFTDSKKQPDSMYARRTIFWLNGGPGCSSMDGALLETGPFRINKDQKVIMNNGSWHKAGDVVYVDQPAGTGYSYTEQDKLLHDLPEMAFYFMKFMEKYYEEYPEEAEYDIYFAGESYAGQYIPYIADSIIKRNVQLKEGQKRYNLKGLLIGNGWVSPNEQCLSYLPFFVDKGLITKENPRWLQLLYRHEQCQRIVDQVDAHFDSDAVNPVEIDSSQCEDILPQLLSATFDGNAAHFERCINMYDYTLKDSYPSCGMNWPMELKYVTPFLQSDDIKHVLNLKKMKTWHECSGRVGNSFDARHSFPSVHLFADLLKQVPIILFNGANDIICNSDGVLQYVKKLKWGGQKGFEDYEAKIDWVHDDQQVGYILQERNLTFINIYNSSHMVPYDLPDVSRALLDLVSDNYDKRQHEGKAQFVTYPLGIKAKGVSEETEETPTESSEEPAPASSSSETSTTGTSATAEGEEEDSSANKITRVIQLGVILVVLWGIYILYASWRARPSPIMKKSSNGRRNKKNVQWADQLSMFEEEADASQPKGFFAKTLDRFKGRDSQGSYARAESEDYTDDIELGDSVSDSRLDDFIVGSDDEVEGAGEREGEREEEPADGGAKTSSNP